MLKLGFGVFPRSFGNPIQTMVDSIEEFHKLLNINSGRNICFMSHNPYTQFKTVKNKRVPTHMMSHIYFIDLDDQRKPENALLDARVIMRWADDRDIPVAVAFSGRKGFHIYILLKPEELELTNKLNNLYKALRFKIVEDTHIRTSDPKVAEPKRLCRVWYARYVGIQKRTKKQIIGQTFCVPLKPEWVMDWSFQDILEYSKNPSHPLELFEISTQDMSTKERTFTELCEFLDVKEGDAMKEGVEPLFAAYGDKYNHVNERFVKELFGDRFCLHEILTTNPRHYVRFAAVAYLKSIGKSRAQVLMILQGMNWIDYDADYTYTQVENIFNSGYFPPSCSKMKAEKCCVGEICPRFFKQWQPPDDMEIRLESGKKTTGKALKEDK